MQAVNRRQVTDQFFQVSAHKRFATGQPDLLDSQADKEIGKSGDLFKREDFAFLQPLVLVSGWASVLVVPVWVARVVWRRVGRASAKGAV